MEVFISIIAIALAFGLGYLWPRGKAPKLSFKGETIKVFNKATPKTFEEERQEALDNNKPMIKRFEK